MTTDSEFFPEPLRAGFDRASADLIAMGWTLRHTESDGWHIYVWSDDSNVCAGTACTDRGEALVSALYRALAAKGAALKSAPHP